MTLSRTWCGYFMKMFCSSRDTFSPVAAQRRERWSFGNTVPVKLDFRVGLDLYGCCDKSVSYLIFQERVSAFPFLVPG